jgi:hypothetical protein
MWFWKLKIQGFWLLLHTLISTFTLCMLLWKLKQGNNFKLCISLTCMVILIQSYKNLSWRWWHKFLMYLGAIIHIFKNNHLDWSICNMLSIMFDPCFKNMNIIQDYVSNSTLSEVVKYGTIVVYPLNYYKCIFI